MLIFMPTKQSQLSSAWKCLLTQLVVSFQLRRDFFTDAVFYQLPYMASKWDTTTRLHFHTHSKFLKACKEELLYEY